MKIGYVALYRSIQEHWTYTAEAFSKGQAWVDLILSANHTERKILMGNELILIKRGQLVTSELKLMKKWKWSKTKVRNYLLTLQKDNMIIKDSDSKKTIITICNYDKYQFSKTAKEPAGDCSSAIGKLKEDTNNNVNTFKNDKKFINVVDVIDEFNQVCGEIFKKQKVELLSEDTKELLKSAAKFLEDNQLSFKDYFQLCKIDNFLNGTKDPDFIATFQYLMKLDVIERVLSVRSKNIESNEINDVIHNSNIMRTIVETSDEATDIAKKKLIEAVAEAYERGFQDDEILSCINARYLISRVQDIYELINKGAHHER